MRVRPAAVPDADAIAGVHVRSWQVAYRGQVPDDHLDRLSLDHRRNVWEAILAGSALPRAGTLVLEDGERILGFAQVVPSRDADAAPYTGELAAIYLEPEAWGSGGGRLLVEAAMANLRAAGFRRATVWVLQSNARARRFYELTGWTPDGAVKTDDRGSFALVEIRYTVSL